MYMTTFICIYLYIYVANERTSSYNLVFKDTWGIVLSVYMNNYVLLTAVIIHWGCMVTYNASSVLSPSEANSSIICYQRM